MTLSTYPKINWTIKTRVLTGQLSIANTPQIIPQRRMHFSVSGVAAVGNPFHRPNGGQDDQEPDRQLIYTRFPLQSRLYQQHLAVGQ